MKQQTITIHTRLQDNQDGGYSFFGYGSQDELIANHPANDDGDITDKRRQEILDEDDPYEDGYIGTNTIEVAVDGEGKVYLVGELHFHAGQ